MQQLKKNATDWVQDELKKKSFYWHEGYAAFSASATSRTGVRGYFNNQEKHHEQKLFRDERIELLELSGVQYDPKYPDQYGCHFDPYSKKGTDHRVQPGLSLLL